MEGINPYDRIGYADIIEIVFENKCVEIFLCDDSCLNYTFEEVLQEAKRNGYAEGRIILIAESPLSGKVYQYGNYGNYWVEHGTTRGYA